MILYNVTVTIDLDIHEDWVNWMRVQHIPDVMSTNMFLSYRMSRLINHEHADSEIYTIQYLVKDMAHLLRYNQEFAPELQRQHRARYEGKFVAFRTVMEVVDHNERVAPN
ncbi:MAG: DUF4286 family protein [Saprospiraceae bacterium]|nr:DUF4286 family protein [Saprospiraceae bacterium]